MANEEECVTFTWKLENLRYCLEKKEEGIESPTFILNDKTQWYLGLFPRGDENSNYIGCLLIRDEDCKGALQVPISYELSLMREDGSTLSHTSTALNFPKGRGHGPKNFVKIENIFATEGQNNLTICCKIWRDGEKTESIQYFARTRIEVQKISYVWKIENFSTLGNWETRTWEIKPLNSITFSLTGGLSSKEMIRIKLSLQDEAYKFSTFLLSLVDASGNTIECNRDEFWYGDKPITKEFIFFFPRNKLIEMKSMYLPNDVLSLHWEWVFSNGVISDEIECVQYTCIRSGSKFSNIQDVGSSQKTTSLFSLNDLLKPLYDEKFLCDVKLRTNTREFDAHKVILSAASPVFKSMFSSGMKENINNCVDIEDLKDDTIDRMLAYIYTAQMEDLTWERASHLYVAADKYAIFNLKKLCSTYMKDNLSPSNAWEVLLLSDFHIDDDLKSATQRYIFKYSKPVINSDGWKLLMETDSKLAAETLSLLHK